MIRRHLEEKLDQWALTATRRPLLLLGARQVGKTFLIQEWGRSKFPAVHTFNFERTPRLTTLFEEELSPSRIVSSLELISGRPINSKDLIFFDEIQESPKAITSLKYFAEALRSQPLIAAGSLLGVTLSDQSFPVGKVEEFHLYPLTFEEYLAAAQPALHKTLDESDAKGITGIEHNALMSELKKFFICGGLPAATSIFLNSSSIDLQAVDACRNLQKELVRQYMSDFAKHSGRANAMHLERVFTGVAGQLGKAQNSSVKRFQFSGVVPKISQYSRLVSTFDWLERASLIHRIPMVHHPATPLRAHSKESFFKAYFLDVGLLGAHLDLPANYFSDPTQDFFSGYIAENFACQELIANGARPFSWTAEKSQAEIEFIIQTNAGVIPIEIKSGINTRARSLASYVKQYRPGKAYTFSAAPPSSRGAIKNLPLYLIGSETRKTFT